KLYTCACVGIEPFTLSLQSALVGEFCKVDQSTDIRYPEAFFEKAAILKEYGSRAHSLLYKSDLRKRIDSHFQQIVKRIATLRDTNANAEQVKVSATQCSECGKPSADFRNALNERVCYEYFERNPRYCSGRTVAEQKWRQAKDVARQELLDGREFSVHPR